MLHFPFYLTRIQHTPEESVLPSAMGCKLSAWSVMLELVLRILHVPWVVNYSCSDFLPFAGLRTCNLCCDNHEQWELLALNKLWTCLGEKVDSCSSSSLSSQDTYVHTSQTKAAVQGSHPVSPWWHCTKYNYCSGRLERNHHSCGLLSWPWEDLLPISAHPAWRKNQWLRWRPYGCLLLWGQLQARAALQQQVIGEF